MNAHDAIVDAFLAALRAPLAVTEGLIDEEIDAATIGEHVREAVSIVVSGSAPQRIVIRGAPIDWQTEIDVECYARADGRTPGGRASRALFARVYARLAADPTLGGLAMDMAEPVLRGDTEQMDNRLGCVIATYAVMHRTAAGSLEQPA